VTAAQLACSIAVEQKLFDRYGVNVEFTQPAGKMISIRGLPTTTSHGVVGHNLSLALRLSDYPAKGLLSLPELLGATLA
jgi:hypothetical protein